MDDGNEYGYEMLNVMEDDDLLARSLNFVWFRVSIFATVVSAVRRSVWTLESLLDIMAVGNPTMQAALADRRAALRMQQPDPEAGTSSDWHPANYAGDVGL
ncbi:hypothetical protein Bca52824_035629 [Brassica carinata]|uniref:Uncharacterized protein n=1 Tax=Brassica carinata TaxID=52824 RepID=A0A8X7S3S3_BRACI|nr:hypothetical protein Bca52824_035629 [Brassica carinata]